MCSLHAESMQMSLSRLCQMGCYLHVAPRSLQNLESTYDLRVRAKLIGVCNSNQYAAQCLHSHQYACMPVRQAETAWVLSC